MGEAFRIVLTKEKEPDSQLEPGSNEELESKMEPNVIVSQRRHNFNA
ncbi:hypothetical protein [Anoxybacter fermentans]|nr:hypothetical protein [Anoxybacter fermentans]